MNRYLLIALLIVIGAASACSNQVPSNEATPEVVPPVAPETTPETTEEASSIEWERFIQSDATAPGWVLQHPSGWTVFDAGDGVNIFLYSTADAGDRLFNSGLQPGEMVFQFSNNRTGAAGETPRDHLTALTSGFNNATLGEIQPVTIAGIEGVQQRGEIESLGLSFTASSRPFLTNQFIDIIAYSRTDEFDTNLSLMNTVIETVRYVLATE